MWLEYASQYAACLDSFPCEKPGLRHMARAWYSAQIAPSCYVTAFNHPISWHSRTQLKHPHNVGLQTLLCLFLWPWRRDNSASATVSVDALQKGWYETNEPWLLILMKLQNSHRSRLDELQNPCAFLLYQAMENIQEFSAYVSALLMAHVDSIWCVCVCVCVASLLLGFAGPFLLRPGAATSIFGPRFSFAFAHIFPS